MPRSSFTWLFSAWLLLTASPVAARPLLCLPPQYERGQRLHPLEGVRVLWLEPLLRQHELCWRRPRGEQAVALFGNSAVFGFPLPVEQSFGARLNEHFAAADLPAHLFNLGWIFTYQIRDALIMHETMRYAPDVLVYPLTLADMFHYAPAFFPPQLVTFFEQNTGALAEMIAAPPPGIEEPIALYRPVVEAESLAQRRFRELRQLGVFARAAARQHAEALTRRVAALPPDRMPKLGRRQLQYDCEKTIQENALHYPDWQTWNMPAYLAHLRAETGAAVLLINWPIAHEPVGDCYNVRYSNAIIAEYNQWLAEQARTLDLPYLDLHDLLPADDFIDSLHVTPAGHQRIAAAVAEALDPILRQRAAREHE